jgi:hypothetical protein
MSPLAANQRLRSNCFRLLFAILLVQSGCGIAYQINRDELMRSAKASDWNPPPPSNWQDIETQLIDSTLKDPDGARYRFAALERNVIQSTDGGTKPLLVWRSDVGVNSKNSFGGYVGYQPFQVAWHDGKIIAIVVPEGEMAGFWQYFEEPIDPSRAGASNVKEMPGQNDRGRR